MIVWSGLRVDAQSRRLVFASTEFPPYYAQDLPQYGPISEIVTAACEHMGYTVEFRFYPWARALSLGELGTVDGLSGIWISKERERSFLFSNPLPGNTIILMKRAGSGPSRFTSLESLGSLRIGTVRGYVNPAGFDEAALNVEAVTEDLQNLKKLQAHRLDLVLIDREVGRHLIQRKLPEAMNAFEELTPPLEYKNLYLAIPRQNPAAAEIVEAFNRGLEWITRQGQLKAILAKHGM
jgi:polar amino acid transport system substrate-binding protein